MRRRLLTVLAALGAVLGRVSVPGVPGLRRGGHHRPDRGAPTGHSPLRRRSGPACVVALLAGLLTVVGPTPSASAESTVSLTIPADMMVGVAATIDGVLTDGGAAVGGASLVITDTPADGSEERTRTVTVNAAGAFSFSYTPRSYADTLVVHYAGDATHAPVTQAFHANASRRPVALSLEAPNSIQPLSPVTITGTLTSLGEPAPGVELDVTDECGSNSLPSTVTTDENGVFTVTDTPGRYCRHAYYQFDIGYLDSDRYGTVRAARQVELDWQLSDLWLDPTPPAAVVGSTLTWTGGVAVEGSPRAGLPVTVRIMRNSELTDVAQLTSDESGEFAYSRTFDRVGAYEAEFRYEGDDTAFWSARVSRTSITAHPTTLSVDQPSLTARGGDTVTISGTALDDEGAPLPDRLLEVWRGGEQILPVRTDQGGRFSFERTVSVPSEYPYESSEEYTVVLPADELHTDASARAVVDVRREPTRLTIAATPDGTEPQPTIRVDGQLTALDDETPVAGVPVQVNVRGGVFSETRVVTTGADGAFSFPVELGGGGRYDVEARFEGTPVLFGDTDQATWEGPAARGILTLHEPDPILVGEVALIRGRITDTSGNPDPTVLDLTWVTEDGEAEYGGAVSANEDGRFSVRRIGWQAERVSLVVTSRTYRTSSQTKSVVIDILPLALTGRARNARRTAAGWAIYDRTTDPRIDTKVTPARPDLCLVYAVERLKDGVWRPWSESACRTTDATGHAAFTFGGRHRAGTQFRIRPERRARVDTLGNWVKVRFR